MNKLDSVLEVASSYDCDLAIQKITPVGGNAFQIIASHATRDYSNEQYMEAIAALTENKMSVVPNSICRYNSKDFSYKPHVKMIVKANVTSKAYNETNTKQMKVVASNVFMSEEDNSIWKKVGEGEQARLIQTSDDDYNAILQARKSRSISTLSSMIEDIKPMEKDYVAFYNDKEGKVSFGIMASSDIVIDRETNAAIKIEPKQVVEAVAFSGDSDLCGEIAMIQTENLDKMLNYMRVLYGNHPEFFDRLESLIRQRNSMGDVGNYTSAVV